MARQRLPIFGLGGWFSGGRYYLVGRGRGDTDACLALVGLFVKWIDGGDGVGGATLTLVASRLDLSREGRERCTQTGLFRAWRVEAIQDVTA